MTASGAVETGFPRRRLAPADRKAELLDAASRVFGHSGYQGSSLRAIAREAGISLAGLMHHYPTKEQLLAAVLDLHDQALRAATLKDVSEMSLVDEMVAMVSSRVSDPEFLRLGVILQAESTDPHHPAHDHMVAMQVERSTALARRLASRVATGELRDGLDSAQSAQVMSAFLTGLYTRWLLDPRLDAAQLTKAFVGSSGWLREPALFG